MARKTAVVTITANNRDQGKTFTIEEMPSEQAEEWFARAFRVLAIAGVDVPANIIEQGPMGFAAIGVGAALTSLAKAPWDEFKYLMDDMMTCVKSFIAPGGHAVSIPQMISTQIEEVSTRARLREEILSLHVNFSIRDYLSTYRELVAAKLSENGPSIATSPKTLEQ